MKSHGNVLLILLTLAFGLSSAAQELPKVVPQEESAEVFLEEYTDEFQNTFFEALKQKGIQNYDRAANLFLECKRLDSVNPTIDHELAKTYLMDKKYIAAQDFALQAVNSIPSNYWFLHTLVEILEKQSFQMDVLRERLPMKNDTLKENLALIYFKKAQYSDALAIVQKLKSSEFKKDLKSRIQDSLALEEKPLSSENATMPGNDGNPAKKLQAELEQLINTNKYSVLEEKAREATEEYPLQPFFYYAYGLALNANQKYMEAISSLETAQDFIFEENVLSQNILDQLVKAHTALGNQKKANEYRNKMKSGL